MERILVTGATTPLGRHLVRRLIREPGVQYVVGAEPRASTEWIEGVELIEFPSDARELADLLRDEATDTILHCGMAPGRSGGRAWARAADVVGTMRLCAAAAQSGLPVRSLVLASDTSVYPAAPYAPLRWRETDAPVPDGTEPAASLLEAEDYARDAAARAPHLNVAILRLAELTGAGLRGPLSDALAQPLRPAPIGYDPAVQWLHADDAVDALAFAARLELAGVYNVASAGVLRWREALAGGSSVPVLPVEAGFAGPWLRRLGVPHVPAGAGSLLRFGRAVDTAKLCDAGWTPKADQRACAAAASSEAPEQGTATSRAARPGR